MQVIIENLSKKFGNAFALKDINLTINEHELFFLLGPSGCGKTTLLRTIAGFYKPDDGKILFGEKIMNDVSPHKRNTGMVFQNYALWPHMTIEENVAYGLQVRGLTREEIKKRVHEALSIVQMEKYAERTPNQLSGGQQQRIALARALVIKPDVLLLDEPLSNLDARLRLEMRTEIRRIHDQTKITTIYVTHDQKEALSLADRIALLRDGQIEQVGDPRTIYRAPLSKFGADFIGEINWLKGKIVEVIDSQYTVQTQHGVFKAEPQNKVSTDKEVWLGFRPEAVEIKDENFNSLNTVIEDVTYLGEIEQYTLRVSENVAIKAFEQNPFEIRKRGEKLKIHVRPINILLYKAD
ncbi:MAG: ABC transporter ATP-binding protein [Verrucomicrobiae bacterium]|nr:ABC transporter ATP-binding protein [Verrucomicrobiae bacterium]